MRHIRGILHAFSGLSTGLFPLFSVAYEEVDWICLTGQRHGVDSLFYTLKSKGLSVSVISRTENVDNEYFRILCLCAFYLIDNKKKKKKKKRIKSE